MSRASKSANVKLAMGYACACLGILCPLLGIGIGHGIDISRGGFGHCGETAGMFFGVLVGAVPVVTSIVLFWSFLNKSVPQDSGKCPKCNYDLTGTLKAGNITCPECGHVIAEQNVE